MKTAILYAFIMVCFFFWGKHRGKQDMILEASDWETKYRTERLFRDSVENYARNKEEAKRSVSVREMYEALPEKNKTGHLKKQIFR